MKSLLALLHRSPRTPQSQSRRYTDRVTLDEESVGDRQALTPIPYPDGLTPRGHSLPRLDPHAVDLHQTVSDVVHGLAEAGALDEFTTDVLGNWIDAMHASWVPGVREHAESRRITASRLEAATTENLERETEELAQLTARHSRESADQAAFALELGLVTDTGSEVVELAARPEVVEPDAGGIDPEASSARDSRKPHSMASAARVYVPESHVRRDTAVSIAVLIVASLVDIALAKNAFDVALRLPEAMSWFVAGGVGLIAVAGAFASGVLTKGRVWPLAAAVVSAPILIAIALFILRAGSAGDQPAVTYGTQASGLTGSADESILAPVMLLVFLATTILAFADGWRLTDTDRLHYRAVTESVAAVAAQLAEMMGRVARLHKELAIHTAVLDRIDDDREIALNALDAVADELREWARVEVVRELGDPRSTSAIHDKAPRKAGAQETAA